MGQKVRQKLTGTHDIKGGWLACSGSAREPPHTNFQIKSTILASDADARSGAGGGASAAAAAVRARRGRGKARVTAAGRARVHVKSTGHVGRPAGRAVTVHPDRPEHGSRQRQARHVPGDRDRHNIFIGSDTAR